MALELAKYNFKNVDWVRKHLDIYHFVKKMNYKKYQAYINYKVNSPEENNTKSKEDLE